MNAKLAVLMAAAAALGGGGMHAALPPANGERIATLEARQSSTDHRLGRIEDKLDRILERLK